MRANASANTGILWAVPELERQEIYEIYQSKGFNDELLDHIVNTITATMIYGSK